MKESENGWTRWVKPKPDYKLGCCDCGLVHDIQFRIDRKGNIRFRAKRNQHETSKIRKRENITL